MLVESYRPKFGFQEGSDVAVVSLRDDVKNVRAEARSHRRTSCTSRGRLEKHPPWRQNLPKGPVADPRMPGSRRWERPGIDSACLATEEVESPFQVPSSGRRWIRGYQLHVLGRNVGLFGKLQKWRKEGEIRSGCSLDSCDRLTRNGRSCRDF